MSAGNVSKKITDLREVTLAISQGEYKEAARLSLKKTGEEIANSLVGQFFNFLSNYQENPPSLDLENSQKEPSLFKEYRLLSIPNVGDPTLKEIAEAQEAKEDKSWIWTALGWGTLAIGGGGLVLGAWRLLKAAPLLAEAPQLLRALGPAAEMGGSLVRATATAVVESQATTALVSQGARAWMGHALVRATVQAGGTATALELVQWGINEALEPFEGAPPEAAGDTDGVGETEGVEDTEGDSDTDGDEDPREAKLRHFLTREMGVFPSDIPEDLRSTHIGQLLLSPAEGYEFELMLKDFSQDLELLDQASKELARQVSGAQSATNALYFNSDSFEKNSWNSSPWKANMANFLVSTRPLGETRPFGALVYEESAAILLIHLFLNLQHVDILGGWMSKKNKETAAFTSNLVDYYLFEAGVSADSNMTPKEYLEKTLGFVDGEDGISIYQDASAVYRGEAYHTGRPGSAVHAYMNTWLLFRQARYAGRINYMQGRPYTGVYDSLTEMAAEEGLEPLQVEAARQIFATIEEQSFELRAEISGFGFDMMHRSEVFNFFKEQAQQIESLGMDYLTQFHPGEPFQSTHRLTATWRHWLLAQWFFNIGGVTLNEEAILENQNLDEIKEQWQELLGDFALSPTELESALDYLTMILEQEKSPMVFAQKVREWSEQLDESYQTYLGDVNVEDPQTLKLVILVQALVYGNPFAANLTNAIRGSAQAIAWQTQQSREKD